MYSIAAASLAAPHRQHMATVGVKGLVSARQRTLSGGGR